MANDLIAAAALDAFPGGPFTDEQVDAAVGALRRHCGWHIAPVRTETAVLDVEHGQRLLTLPTLALISVVEVRAPEIVDPANYAVSRRRGAVAGWWPCGFEAVEVDFQHGYGACPPELLPVLAELSKAAKIGGITGSSIKLGELSISGTSTASSDPAAAASIAAVETYTLTDGFA